MSADSLREAERPSYSPKDSLPLSVEVCSFRTNCPSLIEAAAPSLLLAATLHVN